MKPGGSIKNNLLWSGFELAEKSNFFSMAKARPVLSQHAFRLSRR